MTDATDIAPMRSRSCVALDIAQAHPDPGQAGRGHMAESSRVAARLGITRGAVAAARRVLAAGDDHLVSEVRAGRLTVFAAAKRVRPTAR